MFHLSHGYDYIINLRGVITTFTAVKAFPTLQLLKQYGQIGWLSRSTTPVNNDVEARSRSEKQRK